MRMSVCLAVQNVHQLFPAIYLAVDLYTSSILIDLNKSLRFSPAENRVRMHDSIKQDADGEISLGDRLRLEK